MISIRRVSLGGGYRYLIELGRGRRREPGTVEGSRPLLRLDGHPAGRLSRAGLADLDGGRGVEKGSQVSEEHLFNMLVALSDPVSGEPRRSRPSSPCRETVRRSPASTSLSVRASRSRSAWALARRGHEKRHRGVSPPSDRLRHLLRRSATSSTPVRGRTASSKRT